MPTQRNHVFDFLCGICILRMMMNHAIAVCGLRWQHVAGVSWYDLMDWTYFFMCFFFFKAGYFNKTVSGNSHQYCLDRIRRLLVPYVSWSIIGGVVYFGIIAFFPYTFDPKKMAHFEWSHLWQTAHSYGNGPCWFLMSFFTAYIVIHFMTKVRGLRWIIFFFPLLSYLLYTIDSPLPLSLDNVFMGIFFFFLGRIWRAAIGCMGRGITIMVSIFLIAFFITGNLLWPGQYTMSTNTWEGNPWGIVINTTAILCGLSGLLLSLPQRRIPAINFVGQHSMVYFVAHYPLINLYIFIHRAAHSTSYQQNWGECILLIAFIIITCTWLVPYVERVPWLSGRPGKKS